MDVIGHQAVGIDRDAVALAVLGQFFQIDLIVSVFGKSLLSLVPPDDDIIRIAAKSLGFRAIGTV